VLLLGAFILFGIWFHLGNLIAKLSTRIAEIEEEINAMAGKKLLKWEHERRGSRFFFFHRWRKWHK
jgi:hypothetical protein